MGQKIRGAFESVQGMADTVRGGAMDFVDSATNTGSGQHQATTTGAHKTEEGIHRMEHGGPSGQGTKRGDASGVVTVEDLRYQSNAQSTAQNASGERNLNAQGKTQSTCVPPQATMPTNTGNPSGVI